MFCLKSTLMEAQFRANTHKIAYETLVDKYNNLVTRVNKLGGASFLQGESLQFNKDEIKSLISLCHPDKHHGSEIAKDITAKLLELR